jgi:hypothetical protein
MPGGIFRDLTGQRFGRLTVTERGPSRHGAQWVCKCDCGGSHLVMAKRLQEGSVRSCGCLKAQLNRERMEDPKKLKKLSASMKEHWKITAANRKSARHKKLAVVFTNPSNLSHGDREGRPKTFSEQAALDLAAALGLRK